MSTPCTRHHFHANERGWECCHCPERISKRRTPPDNHEDTPCARLAADGPSWLGPNTRPSSVRLSQVPAGAVLMRPVASRRQP